MLHHQIISAKPLPDFMLYIGFENGIYKRYDVRPLLEKWEPFRAFINTPKLFEQVRVDAGGYGISWNDDLDLSSEELWENGEEVPAPAIERTMSVFRSTFRPTHSRPFGKPAKRLGLPLPQK